MKKNLMLIIAMLTALAAVAQEVQVTNLQVSAGNKITFDVSWGNNRLAGKPWSDTVWVFIDYFNMEQQEMWRLPVASATLNNISWAGAKVRTITENNAGFYIQGNAREANVFTAGVSVTPAGDYPQGVIRPCIYVTDHQPVATYGLSGGSVTATLAGTAPYSGTYGNSSTWTSPTGAGVTLPAGQHISAFADATGNSGIARCGTAGSSVTLTSGTATQNQTVCEDSAITGTSYTIGGSATSYTIDGLPGGLTHTMTNKIIRIGGTPTESGTYTITTTGHTAPCEAATIEGTVTVNLKSTITLTSATATQNQTVCEGSAITGTSYTIGGSATSYTIDGLPGGLTHTMTNKIIRIGGTPTESGTYTITTTGHTAPCEAATISGTVTRNALPTVPNISDVARCGAGNVNFTPTVPADIIIVWWDDPSGGNQVTFPRHISTTTTFYAQAHNTTTGCMSSSRQAVKATVNTNPVVTLSRNNATVCSGGASTLTATVSSGTTTAMTYTWYRGATQMGTSTTNTRNLSALTVTAAYSVTVKNSNGCSGTSSAQTVTVNALPTITTQPTAKTICAGETATLEVTANVGSGSGPYYQWKLNGNNISGATSRTYTSGTLSANSTYSVVVSNSNSCSVTSNEATITSVANPSSPQVKVDNSCEGSPVTFTVTNSQSGATYTWSSTTPTSGTYVRSTSSSTGTKSATVTIKVPMSTDLICSATTSASGTVNAKPTVTLSRNNATVCSGGASTLTATVSSGTTTAMTYTWYRGATQIGTSTTNTWNLSNLTSTATYSVTVKNSNGCSGSSPGQTVTVNALPTITTQPTAKTICAGETATLEVTANVGSGSGPYYQWKLNGNNISGATSRTYTSGTLSANSTYSVVVSNSNSCSVTSSNALVTVNALPIIKTHPQSQSVCENSPFQVSVVAEAGSGSISKYEWVYSSYYTAVFPVNSATYSSTATIALYGSVRDHMYSARVTNSNDCSVTSTPATITVSPTSVGGTVNGSSTICAGTTAGNLTLSGHTGTVQRWQSSTNGSSWTNISHTATSYSPGSPTTTTYYRAVVKSGVCAEANSTAATVTVNPKPTVTLSRNKATVCSGEASTLTATVSGGATTAMTYTWYRGNTQIGTSATNILNLSNLTSTATYSVTVKNSNGCSGSSPGQTVTVQTPATAPTSISASASTVCLGTATTLTANGGSNGSGAVYEWGTGSTVGSNKMSPATTTANTRSVSPTNSTTYYWVRRISNTTCTNTTTGVTNSVKVLLTPPSGIYVSSNPVCSGSAVDIVASGSNDPGTIYEWGTGSVVGNNKLSPATTTDYGRTVYPTTTTTYWVRKIRSATCTNTTSAATNTVTVNPKPTVTASTLTVACYASTTMQANVTGGATSSMTYTWKLGGFATYTTTNPAQATTTNLPTTTYTVTVKNSNGCTTISDPATITSDCGVLIDGVYWSKNHVGSDGFTSQWDDIGYDPLCPAGWRIPTYSEFNKLWNNTTLTHSVGWISGFGMCFRDQTNACIIWVPRGEWYGWGQEIYDQTRLSVVCEQREYMCSWGYTDSGSTQKFDTTYGYYKRRASIADPPYWGRVFCVRDNKPYY